MKKVVAWVLVTIVSFIIFADAFAETANTKQVDTEITFRGIPWGSSIPFVESTLTISSISDASLPYEEGFLCVPIYRSMGSETEYKTGYHGSVNSSNAPKVAGYDVSIGLYFAYKLVDGEVIKDKNQARFFAADYVFSPVDYGGAFSDLLEKLSSLYGDPNIKRETYNYPIWLDNVNSGEIENILVTATWDGANGTHIVLYGQWIENLDDIRDMISNMIWFYSDLYVTYYVSGYDEELRAIDRVMRNLAIEEERRNATGVDGL